MQCCLIMMCPHGTHIYIYTCTIKVSFFKLLRLYGVVNNAGILVHGPVEWNTVAEMQNAMDVNLWGTVRITKAMLLPLVKKERGRIVNMSSCGGG